MDEMELTEMELMEFNLIHVTSYQQYWLTVHEAVSTVMCSRRWEKESPETCRAD
jgi:hypothetical protein